MYWIGLLTLFGFLSTTPRTRILILGDSITEGYGVDLESAFPKVLQQKLDSAAPGKFTIISAGITGSTSASAMKRLKWYSKSHPHWVLFALGSNDGLRGIPVGETSKNLDNAIGFCLSQQWQVMLAGLKVPPNYGPEYERSFRRIFPEISKRRKIPLFPFLLEGVAGEPTLNQADGIHPNEKGHQKIASLLTPFIIKQTGLNRIIVETPLH